MPVISIQALPLKKNDAIEKIILELSEDFAAATDIELKHISILWRTIEAGHYAWAGKIAYSLQKDRQQGPSHPVIASILLPDIYKPERICQLLESLALVISQRLGIPKSKVFIYVEKAQSGCVYDDGKIVRW